MEGPAFDHCSPPAFAVDSSVSRSKEYATAISRQFIAQMWDIANWACHVRSAIYAIKGTIEKAEV